jgi:NIMA (never in mitosis gene a)-related kinase 1/4/5
MTSLKPPFRAQDMNGLYKRVIAGKYPPISHKYSKQLSQTIAALLMVDPEARPTIKELLKSKNIVEKSKELEQTTEHFESQNILASMDDEDPMLKTIRVPGNLSGLTGRLPKSNYSKLRSTGGPRSNTQLSEIKK